MKKAIPFVFLSGLASKGVVKEAYKLNIQGFFKKPHNYQKLKEYLMTVIAYLQRSEHPE